MSQQLFESVPVRHTLPFRERRHLEPDTLRYTDLAGVLTLFVLPEALEQLRIGTRRSAPDEAFGLVMGRAYTDSIGAYTIVTGVYYAAPDLCFASAGHVRVEPLQISELRRRAQQRFPAHDVVGWTHSHTRPSGYSTTDLQEQALWAESYQVGILTFMDEMEAPRAYRGPVGAPLTLAPQKRDAPRATEAGPTSPLFAPAADFRRRPPERITVRQSVSDRAARDWKDWLLTDSPLQLFALVFAIMVLGVGFLSWQVAAVGQDVRDLEGHLAPRATTNVAWDCSARGVLIECGANESEMGIDSWLWDFGDGTVISGRTVRHSYADPGSYPVRLLALTGEDVLYVGRRAVNVPPSPTPAARPWRE